MCHSPSVCEATPHSSIATSPALVSILTRASWHGTREWRGPSPTKCGFALVDCIAPRAPPTMVNGVKMTAGVIVGIAEMAALVITALTTNTIHSWDCKKTPAGLLAMVITSIIISGLSGVILLGSAMYALLCCCKGGSQIIGRPWFLFLRPLLLYAISAALYGVTRFVIKEPEGCHIKPLRLFLLIGIPLFASICIVSFLSFLFTCREPRDDEEEIEKAPIAAPPKKFARV